MSKEKEAFPSIQGRSLVDEMYYFNIGNHFEAFKFLGAKKQVNNDQDLSLKIKMALNEKSKIPLPLLVKCHQRTPL